MKDLTDFLDLPDISKDKAELLQCIGKCSIKLNQQFEKLQLDDSSYKCYNGNEIFQNLQQTFNQIRFYYGQLSQFTTKGNELNLICQTHGSTKEDYETYERYVKKFIIYHIKESYPKIIEHLKLMRFKEKLRFCGKYAKMTYYCKNIECGSMIEEEEKQILCHNRYCENPACIEKRYKRNYENLMNYKIKRTRLKHIIAGFPKYNNYTKEDKALEEHVLSIFFKKLRAHGCDIAGFRIWDVNDQDKDNPDTDSRFVHYHYALISNDSTRDFNSDLWHQLRKETIKETGQEFNFQMVSKLRNRATLFSYFAKRMTGLYGHGDKCVTYVNKKGQTKKLTYAFMFPDLVDEETYVRHYHNSRNLTIVSTKQKLKQIDDTTRDVDPLIRSIYRHVSLKKCQGCGTEGCKVTIEMLDMSTSPKNGELH